MTPPSTTDKWAICACWTYDPSLTGYDYEEVVQVFDTREEAEKALNRVARQHLYTIDKDDQWTWCVGVGIAQEPAPGWAPSLEDEKIWADFVPNEFLEYDDLPESCSGDAL